MLAKYAAQGPAADRGRQGRSRRPARHRGPRRRSPRALHRLLRRPHVRRRRARLQGAQGDARRHDRRGVGEHADLRDVEPPPSAARILQREPRDEARRRGGASGRIGRGEDLAVRALRAVDLVLSVQPGRLPRGGRGWLAYSASRQPKTKRDAEARTRDALQFALQRGSRSGRVAWQFARGYAGAAALKKRSRDA